MALNMLKGFEFTEKESVDTYHKQMEAMKLAFADGLKHITEEKEMNVRVNDLLSEQYAEERRGLIGEEAIMPEAGEPEEQWYGLFINCRWRREYGFLYPK